MHLFLVNVIANHFRDIPAAWREEQPYNTITAGGNAQRVGEAALKALVEYCEDDNLTIAIFEGLPRHIAEPLGARLIKLMHE